MSGYTIEFTKRQNEKVDLNEITTTNSLTKTVSGTIYEPSSGWTDPLSQRWWEYRVGDVSIPVWDSVNVALLPPETTVHTEGAYTYYKGPNHGGGGVRYSMRRSHVGNIQTPLTSITTSTDINGSAHIGGISGNANIDEIQTGAPLATLASSEFGLEVNHDGNQLTEIKHLSPLQGTESTELTSTSTVIFTPTATDLTIETVGCNESQMVDRELTNVVVEEL